MVHLRNLKLDPSKTMEEYAKRLATLTPGFSGADIANLCNEAAILAARKDKTFVESIDFELSSERVMAGLERRKLISSEEKKTVAYHESGHAVVSWFLEGGSPLLKVPLMFFILGISCIHPMTSSQSSPDPKVPLAMRSTSPTRAPSRPRRNLRTRSPASWAAVAVRSFSSGGSPQGLPMTSRRRTVWLRRWSPSSG